MLNVVRFSVIIQSVVAPSYVLTSSCVNAFIELCGCCRRCLWYKIYVFLDICTMNLYCEHRKLNQRSVYRSDFRVPAHVYVLNITASIIKVYNKILIGNILFCQNMKLPNSLSQK